MSKIGLGSAQWGMPYGVTNQVGIPAADQVAAILAAARADGVRAIDTAPTYGDSETVLGAHGAGQGFRIVTKTQHFHGGLDAGSIDRAVEDGVRQSLAHLGAARLHGLLAHRVTALLAPDGGPLWSAMERVREAGLVERIGASVYSGDEIDALLDRYPIGIIQLPMNALDHRLIAGGQLRRLAERGVEVHVRSAFLQGILLADADTLPPYFAPYRPVLDRWHQRVAALGLTPLQAAIGFLAALPEVSVVLCGVETLDQYRQIADAARTPVDPAAFADLACDCLELINPFLWKVA